MGESVTTTNYGIVADSLRRDLRVAQVVCFGMPHAKLGEEVAAVVVLREGQQATEREL